MIPPIYWLNLRKDKKNTREFGAPQYFTFDWRAMPGLVLPEDTLYLIHGFNSPYENTFDAYMAQLGMLAARNALGSFKAIVFILWPGGDAGALSWVPAIHRAKEAGIVLGKFKYFEGATILTHSLGARVALTALYVSAATPKNLIMLAPAVDDEAIGEHGEFKELSSDPMSVFFSKQDEVLAGAYRFSIEPATHSLLDYALGYRGREPGETYGDHTNFINCSAIVESHGGYRSSILVADSIRKIVEGETGNWTL